MKKTGAKWRAGKQFLYGQLPNKKPSCR